MVFSIDVIIRCHLHTYMHFFLIHSKPNKWISDFISVSVSVLGSWLLKLKRHRIYGFIFFPFLKMLRSHYIWTRKCHNKPYLSISWIILIFIDFENRNSIQLVTLTRHQRHSKHMYLIILCTSGDILAVQHGFWTVFRKKTKNTYHQIFSSKSEKKCVQPTHSWNQPRQRD